MKRLKFRKFKQCAQLHSVELNSKSSALKSSALPITLSPPLIGCLKEIIYV